MIDLKAEKPVPLMRVARELNVSFSTVWRWCCKGVKAPDGGRVRLEATRLGGKWWTSQEALQRYTEKLSAAHTPPETATNSPSPATAGQLERRAKLAGEQLERLGI